MLKNYLIVALRNIIRQKGYSLINIIGLSTGLAATILLLVYIQHECSYDTMYKNNHLIYRVNTEAQISSGEKIHIPMTSAFLAPELEKNVPEVKHICRLREHSFNFLYNSQSYKINSVLDSDSSFFKIFSIKIIQGDRNKLFNDRYSIILSKKQATKIFGKENPIGKILHSKNLQYTVSGVFEDIPANSHIQFDALRSFNRFKNKEREFGNNGISFYTYLLFQKDCDIEVAKKKVIKIARERFDENAKSQGIEIKTDLQQLLDIHLADEIIYDFTTPGKKSTIYIFTALAFFILLIAIINFINLFIAKSEKRIKEVGLRRVLGAASGDLKLQFWGESLLLTLLSLIIAFGLAELLLPHFAKLTNRILDLTIFTQPLYLLLLIIISFFIIFTSGSYPVFYLGKFNPAVIFRGAGQIGKNKNQLKTILVFFQFVISIFLITNILILKKQVNHMENKELGFNKDQILILHNINTNISNKYETLKDQFTNQSSIYSVCYSESYPGNHNTIQNCYEDGHTPEDAFLIYENRISRNYLSTYQIKIINGRNFNPNLKSDTAKYIINETAAKKLNLKNPIGKKIKINNYAAEIIGIAKDFNFQSLHKNIEPLVFTNNHPKKWACDNISLRIDISKSKEILKYLKKELYKIDPNYIFNYSFLNDHLANKYKTENQTLTLIISVSIVAIILSILGLFTLTSYIAQQKNKEIGIRKILGAGSSNIIVKIGNSIIKWVLLANIFAWPFSWFVMKEWLENFADKTNMSFYLFITGGLIALSIACISIFSRLFSASRKNPVEILKHD